MKKIAVISGKGGVGKSSISASLAIALSKKNKIVAVDCDVDASNLGLVLGIKPDEYDSYKEISTKQKAFFDLDKCIRCGECIKACHFNAIKDTERGPALTDFGCEGCGMCELVCPVGAIEMRDVPNAKIAEVKTKYGFNLFSGQLYMGESGSGKIVTDLKDSAAQKNKEADIMLIDGAAGVGCSVIASISDVDYVVLVTEAAQIALEDLKKAIKTAEYFKIKCGLIINKCDMNAQAEQDILKLAKEKNIEILARLPFDKKFPEALVNLKPIIEYAPEYEKDFDDIVVKLQFN